MAKTMARTADNQKPVATVTPRPTVSGRSDVALLALRLVVGSLFLATATSRWGWFGGTNPPGMGGLEQFLQILGYDARVLLAWLLVATELTAGLFLILGLFTPWGAAGVIGIAFNGAFVMGWSSGFLAGYGGWIGYMGVAIAIALLGPGRYALDRVVPWRSAQWVDRWLIGDRAGLLAIAFGLVVGLIVVTVFGPGFGNTPNFPPPPGG